MRAAAYLQRASRVDPAALSADEVLSMATRNGATALGLEAGILAPGALADLVVVDARTDFFDPEWEPYRRNLPARLVFSTNGSRVDTTVVDGRVVVRGGRLVTGDADEIAASAGRLCARYGAGRDRGQAGGRSGLSVEARRPHGRPFRTDPAEGGARVDMPSRLADQDHRSRREAGRRPRAVCAREPEGSDLDLLDADAEPP